MLSVVDDFLNINHCLPARGILSIKVFSNGNIKFIFKTYDLLKSPLLHWSLQNWNRTFKVPEVVL
jgi:hypothetical protein